MLTAECDIKTPTPAQMLAVRAVAEGKTYHTGARALGLKSAPSFRSRLHTAAELLGVPPKAATLVYVCCQRGLLPLPDPIPDPPFPALSWQASEVLGLIALGHGYDSVARLLHTDRNAVDRVLRRSYRVLGAVNQSQAVYLAVCTGNLPLTGLAGR